MSFSDFVSFLLVIVRKYCFGIAESGSFPFSFWVRVESIKPQVKRSLLHKTMILSEKWLLADYARVSLLFPPPPPPP